MSRSPRHLTVLLLCTCLLLPLTACFCSDELGECKRRDKPKIAVIGAGIGGASTAYFLRQLLGDNISIHVFEKDKVGGRVQTLDYGGKAYELGASIVHDKNLYIKDLVAKAGLWTYEPGADRDDNMAIYNGNEFVFYSSQWTILTLARMVWRWGTAYFRFQSHPNTMLQRFLQIYELQKNGTAFHSPVDLLKRVHLYDLTQQTMHGYLEETLGTDPASQRFSTEFVAAVNQVNYNQDNGLNALAGLVSMLPAVDNSCFAVRGGNNLLPQRLLELSQAHLKSSWMVDKVMAARRHTFELHARRMNENAPGEEGAMEWDQEVSGPFDAVVIAAPLEQSQLQLHGFKHAHHLPPRKYQATHTTYVRGILNPAHFKVAQLPTDTVFVTEGAATHFSSISALRRLPDGLTLYKVFSKEHLHKHVLADMFLNYTQVEERAWHAYPRFSPPEQFAPFKLAAGVFYNNAWENAASAMEMSAISAYNSALLVAEYLKENSVLSGGAKMTGGQQA